MANIETVKVDKRSPYTFSFKRPTLGGGGSCE